LISEFVIRRDTSLSIMDCRTI